MEQSPYAGKQLNIAVECLARHAAGPLAEKTAMVFVRDDLSAHSLSYRELDGLSARFAMSFVRRGLKTGDRVLLRLPNTPVFPAAFFGALRGGFIPVPTSPLLTAPELDYLIADSGASALVTDESLFAQLRLHINTDALRTIYVSGKTSGSEICAETELTTTEPLCEIYPANGRDPAYIVYTSGTTGYPKGVLHAHQCLLGRLPAAREWFPFFDAENNADRILHSGKFNWTYVLGTGMMDPLYHGKTVVVYEGHNSAERWVELIGKFACNIFIGVPTVFRQILQKTAVRGEDLPTLSHAMCAGEHLSDAVLNAWVTRFSFPIYEGLGMSECSYYISQRKGDALRPNSAGKIQTGRKVALLDENLQPVPAGSEGMLCIRRDEPGLFLEYWNSAPAPADAALSERQAQQFRGDWFLTGDYAIADAEGYVFFLGRRDEIIKSFGYRVSPFEIERVYRDCELIEDAVAFAETVGAEKTLISLCVIMKPGETFDAEQIIAWGRERLAAYKTPKHVYPLAKFPRSTNGKILRAQIPKLVASL